ncbi:MAG TPA: tRNA (N6-isopentenyl adenosine(37)-C2)-methylthiotransferase MiaB [Chthoniobacterales bacterium]|nr:tRNA (N6-isopentenyl adenosine(37)-C2)-methylthiotransferase MiaB [Chthoniobacterales bacterium]
MARIYIKTYGCQMNERDAEQVAQMLIDRGHTITLDAENADVVLLNTCSVRDLAEQKALGKMGMLRSLSRNRPVVYGFLGCMAQSRGSTLLDEVPHLDLVVGTQKFHRVADYVDQAIERKWAARRDDVRFAIVDVEEEPDSQSTIRDHVLDENQVTAFVSVMQGCNMHCTFCIVPYTRGHERSRPIPEIVAEVRSLVAKGVKEVTLLGQIVNLYGRHVFAAVNGKSPFVQLLDALHELNGLERIRFTSPHPIGFRSDLIESFGQLPKLVEHIHLPLQSGSNRILKAMHRTYTAEKYLALVDRIRAVTPNMAITTDIIVGYPGETDEDYAMTRELVDRIGFDNAFIFKYSKRKGTPAATMDGQLPDSVKEARNHDLLDLVNGWAKRRNEHFVGGEVEILCEGPSKTNPNRLAGRTRGNKIVVFEGSPEHVGKLVKIQVQRSTGYTLYGGPVRAAE